ncbi:MAG: hypothetical protein ACM34H_08500 [Deltaproteobacteria bacterium]
MSSNNLEGSVIGQFLAALRDRRTELPYPQTGGPVLYLKCWGSDYPYLQGVEQEKRWVPAVMNPEPRRLFQS